MQRRAVLKPDRRGVAAALILFTAWIVISIIIPTIQSPDEDDHIERAYLLGKGVILLDHESGKSIARKEGRSSGGLIDTGLLALFTEYSILPKFTKEDYWPGLIPLTAAKMARVRALHWTGTRAYDEAPGTGYYFPALYLPQAAALAAGQSLGLSVLTSTQLARAAAFSTAFLLIILAFSIYPANPLVIALLFLPMSLFQFSVAGIDGIGTALVIFSVAAFSRIATSRDAPSWMFPALAIATALLATSRLHTAPQFLMLLFACLYSKRKRDFILFGVSLLFFLTWTAAAARITVDVRYTGLRNTFEVASYYATKPHLFAEVLWATLSDARMFQLYTKQFLGHLQDARFPDSIYICLIIYLGTISLLSGAAEADGARPSRRPLLILSAAVSPLIVFGALLITWTDHPAKVIQGVQGRYFLIAAIYFAYGFCGGPQAKEGWMRKAGWAAAIFGGLLSVAATTALLLDRFYVMPLQAEAAAGIPHAAASP